MPKHISEDDIVSLLTETGDLEAVNIMTASRLLVKKIEQALKRKKMSKQEFLAAMANGDVGVKWLLDSKCIGQVRLETLLRAQTVLGINLIDVS